MTRTIAIVNQKGGVAKTTTAVNLGAGLAAHNRRVLLIDLDPQGSLTASLGIQAHELRHTMYELLTADIHTERSIQKTTGNYDLIPADIRLSGADTELAGVAGREMLLKESLADIQGEYDYILIDCPPSLALLTLNGLTAASEIYIPLQTEYLALLGMSQLLSTIETVQKRLNADLTISGIIATLYDERKNLNKEVLESVGAHFSDKLFNTRIRNNVALAEAASHGVDIFDYKKNSNGAADYAALAAEVIAQEGNHE